MRKKWQKQMPLMPQITDHRQSKELEVISDIIDANPIICDRVLQDLNRGKNVAHRTGCQWHECRAGAAKLRLSKPCTTLPTRIWPSTWLTPNR
jgi:hypothetical protein